MGKKKFNELNKGQVGFFVKRDVFGKGNLLGIPSLLAQACVVAALPARLTGAGLPSLSVTWPNSPSTNCR